MFNAKTNTPQPTIMACIDQSGTDELFLQEPAKLYLVERTHDPINRAAERSSAKFTSITRKCRLLCPEACGMQKVSSLQRLPFALTIVTLSCGHVRPEVLPAHGISLEDIGSAAARRLFPGDLIAEAVWRRF